MTLRFLLSNVLDSSYAFVIGLVRFESGDLIPSQYLDMVVRKVVPMNGETEGCYKIKFAKEN